MSNKKDQVKTMMPENLNKKLWTDVTVKKTKGGVKSLTASRRSVGGMVACSCHSYTCVCSCYCSTVM
jgi:hypothetical protein